MPMLIEAIATLSAGLLMFIISLPLVYRKVPMNQIYGIRIPAAFESEQRWYDINAYGGRQLAAWAWLIIASGVIGLFLPEGDASIYMPASTIVVLLAIVIPLLRIGQWARARLEAASQIPAMTASEMARTAKTSPMDNFVNKRSLVPAIVLGLLCVAYVIFINYSAQWLPPRVATHFGASGRPDGWMLRDKYLHLIAILGLALATIPGGLGAAVSVLGQMLNSSGPGSSRAQNQNLSFLCGDFIWLACLLLCFVAGTHYLTIEANRVHPAHLPPTGFALLIAAFASGMTVWGILLVFHAIKKPRLR